jgi:riboflavin synthase
MFTGLVETMGTVVRSTPTSHGADLTIEARFPLVVGDGTAPSADSVDRSIKLGDSVAINGCCLTVVNVQKEKLTFQAGPETLAKTNLGSFVAGEKVNLERSLRFGDRLGGHIVQGHVDGVGTIKSRLKSGEWETVTFEAGELVRLAAPKGSIAVDGVSLTVVDVGDTTFRVALIPHTLAVTTLGVKKVGERVNLETDMFAKYVVRYLEAVGPIRSRS